MGEFRINPENLNVTFIGNPENGCIACNKVSSEPNHTLPFKNTNVKVYQIDDNVQPSKYELNGNEFKYTVSHGYEEIIIDCIKHGDKFLNYTPEDISKLLIILKNRLVDLSKYEFGKNILITRDLSGHGFFDLLILPVPSMVYNQCITCLNVKNVGNREVYKTENFIAYIPFTPINSFEIDIAPIKHISLKEIDDVLAFDLSGIIFNLIKKLKVIKYISIIENENEHFILKLFKEKLDPFTILGINRIYEKPEKLAEEIRKAI